MNTFSVIDIDTWSSGWRVLFLTGAMVPALIGIGVTTYIYKRHMTKILAAFSNSSSIQTAASLAKTQGPVAKGFFINYIYSCIRNSPKLIALGWVSADDIKQFPANIKRLLFIDYILGWTFLIWIVAGWILISIRGHSGL
ncbi:hypothetical protein [Pseudomonas sp. zfem002]|uniref:hypothetical protein n=1 Tax=Pseudomonas sp. zfem002 TaxID=3078197 RepID=UPI002927CE19|nr:hypothetical protein [Pseudomonas sp. zfem002]MDU9391844.1 hypothetical protein [Pseudomonas sp. zfem002]